MKKRHLLLFFFIALFAGISCDSMRTELEPENTNPRLVVQAVWSQEDDFYQVMVRKSQPLWTKPIGEDYYMVKNATIRLKEGSREIIIPWSDGSYGGPAWGYLIPSSFFPLASGQTVTLDVSTTDGYHVTSTCIVPPPVTNNVSPTGIYTAKATGGYEYTFFVDYEITDIPGVANYYETACEATFKNQQGYFLQMEMAGKTGIFSDKQHDGGHYIFTAEGNYTDRAPDDSVHIHVVNISEAMFHFGRSTNTAQNSIEFFSEPTPIYTNIQGGLGIFSIYTSRRYSFPIGDYLK